MQRYFSVQVAASAVFQDAATAPLVANVYVCRHLGNEVSVHAEVHDPDNFPGTPPTYLPLQPRTRRSARLSDEQLQAELTSAGQRLVSAYGASRTQLVAPAPDCLPRVVNMGEEAQVRTSSFWGQLYAGLDAAALGALPVADVAAMAQNAEELESSQQLRFADKLMLMAYPDCIRLQDGVLEWADMVAKAPAKAALRLADSRKAWLQAAVDRAKSCANAPVAFELSDFLADGALRVLACGNSPTGAAA